MSNRKVIVAVDLAALVETAAKRIAARITASRKPVTICLTGGSTPKPVYERLAREPYRTLLPWDGIHWFWGDDRFVPLDDNFSNAGMALRTFLAHLPVPTSKIHPVPTSTKNPQEAALIYEAELKHHYGRNEIDPTRPLFDLVLMGLGSDGHTASLFPGSSALTENHRWVVGVDKPGLAPFLPRVTLTFPTMSSTREMLFLVSGVDKRQILSRVFAEENLPAAQAYATGELIWLVDSNASPEK